MIVCHCNAVSDRRISAEAGLGAASVEDITMRCDAGNDCGRCVPAIERVLGIRTSTRFATHVAARAS